jgi:hypothetical protein
VRKQSLACVTARQKLQHSEGVWARAASLLRFDAMLGH